MRSEVSPWLKRTAALATVTLITSGCAGLPSMGDVSTMSVRISGDPLGGPRASATGESDAGPGKAAKAVLPASEMCTDIMAIVCAVFIPVAVPIAAVVGAVAKASQKLPLEQVAELNRVSAGVASQLNLAGSLSAALRAEAQRRSITLNAANAGAEILVVPRSLSWNIKAGNRVALRMEVDVTAQVGNERGSRHLTYRSGPARVDEWVADDGQAIRQSLEEAMVGASRVVWDRILGAERGGT